MVHLVTLSVLSSSLDQLVDPLLEELLCQAGLGPSHGVVRTRVLAEKAAGAVCQWHNPTTVPADDGVHSHQRRIRGHHLRDSPF